MADTKTNSSSGVAENGTSKAKKQILLNAFDMSTVGHLSPGQWKVSRDLTYDSGFIPVSGITNTRWSLLMY